MEKIELTREQIEKIAEGISFSVSGMTLRQKSMCFWNIQSLKMCLATPVSGRSLHIIRNIPRK